MPLLRLDARVTRGGEEGSIVTSPLGAVVAEALRRRSETPRLPTEVARILAEAIQHGVWPPGAQFPTDKELSETFGVSRSVIREALACLKYDGIIKARPGSGTVVMDKPAWKVIRFDEPAGMGRREMRDLFEFRLHVEASSSELAARNRTPFDVEVIAATIEQLEHAIRDGELGWEADYRFHLAIAAATKNPYFTKFIDFIASNLRKGIKRGRETNILSLDRVLDEHCAIFAAVREGDADGARRAMVLHHRNSMISLDLAQGTIKPPM